MSSTAATINSDKSELIVAFRASGNNQTTRTIAVFSTEDGSLTERMDATQRDMPASWDIDSVSLSPDDRFLAVGYDYHNYILDRKSKDLVLVNENKGGLPARKIVLFSPNSRRAILFGRRRILWDLQERKSLADLGAYNDAQGMTFSPGGNTLYINGNEGPRLIRAKTGEVIHQFDRQSIEVLFNPKGTRMIPLQYNLDEISLWDFENAKPLCKLTEGSSATL